jgi:hypothetical protein
LIIACGRCPRKGDFKISLPLSRHPFPVSFTSSVSRFCPLSLSFILSIRGRTPCPHTSLHSNTRIPPTESFTSRQIFFQSLENPVLLGRATGLCPPLVLPRVVQVVSSNPLSKRSCPRSGFLGFHVDSCLLQAIRSPRSGIRDILVASFLPLSSRNPSAGARLGSRTSLMREIMENVGSSGNLVELLEEKTAGKGMPGCRTVRKQPPPFFGGVPPCGRDVRGKCLPGEWYGRREEYCGLPSGRLSLHRQRKGLPSFAVRPLWGLLRRPPAVLPPSRPWHRMYTLLAPHIHGRATPLSEGGGSCHPPWILLPRMGGRIRVHSTKIPEEPKCWAFRLFPSRAGRPRSDRGGKWA